jgi:hypothetical protein
VPERRLVCVAIVIQKVDGGYLGQVSPPDGQDWRSPAPSSLDKVRAQFRELGCRPSAIAEALEIADRTWREHHQVEAAHRSARGA